MPPRPPDAPPAGSGLGGVLVLAVVVLGFLLGSAPARNSDVWLHLATGRALVDGSWRFGPNPFSYTAEGPWVVHSWLWDLLSYGLFKALGGPALIVFKALLIAALAAVLVVLGGGRSRIVAAFCAALAVLVLGVRLPLQPVCVSFLFLGLTLLLLERGVRARQERPGEGWLRAYWPLLVLFVLWVNLDAWFFLGPVTVGLYLLGTALGGRRPGADLGGLALLVPAGLVACLVNPWHVHAFTLPPELGLSRAAVILRHDPSLATLSLSPFQSLYYSTPGVGLNAAGLAFFLLAMVSLGSFALNPRGGIDWRGPVWLAFFLLAAFNARAVPFFAVVAGPVLARNLLDFAVRREDLFAAWGPVTARVGLAAVVCLVVAAWPGWLQGTPHERRLWEVVPDPSIGRAAQQIARWRQENRLTEDRYGLPSSLDAANYFAWFCPAEKSWVDGSMQAPAAAARDYLAVRRELFDPNPEGPARWKRTLRAYGVDHLILYDLSPERLQAACDLLFKTSAEWELLLVEGRTVVFGWRDPERHLKQDPFAALAWDLQKEAFQPAAAKQAPPTGAGRTAQPAEWWTGLVSPHTPRSPETDEANLYLNLFDLYHIPARQASGFALLNGTAAAALGAGASGTLGDGLWRALKTRFVHALWPPGGEEPAPGKTGMRRPLDALAFRLMENHLEQGDDGPPALLFLAIRAARRALHSNPDDAQAYLALGQAYLRLMNHTSERRWSTEVRYLDRLRSVQAAGALNQALLLQPDLAQAHFALGLLYKNLGYKDLTLKHAREVLRLSRERGRLPGETPEEASRRFDSIVEWVRRANEEVEPLRDLHTINSQNMRIADQAQLAVDKGLADKALETLLKEPDLAGAAGKDGVKLELELLLATGRLREVREWMTPGHEKLLGGDVYYWLRAQLEAASGNYDKADAALAATIPPAEREVPGMGEKVSNRAEMSRLLAGALLARVQPPAITTVAFGRLTQVMYLGDVENLASFLTQRAGTAVVRGLLALEAGNMARADELMRGAVAVWESEDAAASGAGLDFHGRAFAQDLLKSWAPAR